MLLRANQETMPAEKLNNTSCFKRRTVNVLYLPLWEIGNRDILRDQEKNNTHRPHMHLSNRDGEDQDPGEEAGQRVDDHQRRITQQQPHICGEAMLQNTIDGLTD